MFRSRLRMLLGAAFLVVFALGFVQAGTASHTVPVPATVVAIGDSITTAWAAGGTASDNKLTASWATGDTSVDSHLSRLARRTSGTIAVSNVGVPGRRMITNAGHVPSQAASVSADTELVLIGAGSADLCHRDATTAAGMTSEVAFEGAFRSLLTALVGKNLDIRMFVMSVPDWYGTWERHQGDPEMQARWTVPGAATCQLLFDPVLATPETRLAVRDRTLAYNAIFASVCAEFAGCRYDDGAAHSVEFGVDDLSTLDGFHPSVAGQAKLAAATWPAGWHAMHGAVTGFAAVGGEERVDLSWTAPAGAAGVVVRESTAGTPSGPTDGTEVHNGAGSSVTLTRAAGTYYYAAFAFDVDGDAGPAAAASAVVTAPPPPVGAIADFVGVPGEEQVDLSWTIPAGAVGVLVRESTAGTPSGPTDGLEAYRGSDSGVVLARAGGTTYHYAAFAFDVGGSYGPAAVLSVTPTSKPPVQPPAQPPSGSSGGSSQPATSTPPQSQPTAPQPTAPQPPAGAVLGVTKTLYTSVKKGTRRANVLRGTSGRDRLSGLRGNDRLYGRGSSDVLLGGTGGDRIYGQEGRDILMGGSGRDRLYGGLARDVIVAVDGWRDYVHCGKGVDRAIVDRFDVVAKNCESVRRVR